MHRMVWLLCAGLAAGLEGPAAWGAENWPDYRGPGQQGHSDATGLPLEWSEDHNVAWKTPIPHRGHSSPVIRGERVWLTTATEDGTELYAIAVHRDTGEVLFNEVIFDVAEPERINPLNSYASPSPVIEQGRVYVHFGTYGTAAIDTETFEVIWRRRDLNVTHVEGPGASPVLFENLLILGYDGTDDQFIVGLDKDTGETVWRTERSIDLSHKGTDMHKAYCTPLLIELDGEPRLISPAAQGVFCYDPRTGEEVWNFRYDGYSNVPRPIVGHGMVFISTGYNVADLVAIRLGGRGDITDDYETWRLERRQVPRRPSPILVDDLIYMVSDSGIAQAVEARTGETVWRERMGGEYSASPIHADGRLYFFNQEGVATVLEPRREYRVLATNKLDEGLMGSPAVSGSALFLRTATHLYRIEE